MLEQETPTTPINTEQASVDEIVPNVDDLVKKYESLVKQQQQQIQQLIKQQELNSKVNKQLGEALQQQQTVNTSSSAPTEHWVDTVIRDDFQKKATYNYANSSEPSGQLAVWMTKYLKEREGCTNEEVADRMKKMFQYMQTGKQEQESPQSYPPIPHEIKYR